MARSCFMEEDSVRTSTLTLLTLTALTTQHLTQQAIAASADYIEDPLSASNLVLDDRQAMAVIEIPTIATSPPENLANLSLMTIDAVPTVSLMDTTTLDQHPAIASPESHDRPMQSDAASVAPTVSSIAMLEHQMPSSPALPLVKAKESGDLPAILKPMTLSGDGMDSWSPANLVPVTSTPLSQLPSLQSPSRGSLERVSERAVKQRIRRLPRLSTATSERRVLVRQLTSLQVTNRTAGLVTIELVGRLAPITLRPGQTRQLRVNPRELSLMYWIPDNRGLVHSELSARVSQSSRQTLAVDLLPSRFPNSNLAIYLPDALRRSDILKVF